MAYRQITIEAVLNGFIVQVGCQRVVFRSADELLEQLRDYYVNPKGVEALYLNTEHAKKVGIVLQPQTPSLPTSYDCDVLGVPSGVPSTSVSVTGSYPPQTTR